MGKSKVTKIVIACDGTWQSAATGNVDNPTNVVSAPVPLVQSSLHILILSNNCLVWLLPCSLNSWIHQGKEEEVPANRLLPTWCGIRCTVETWAYHCRSVAFSFKSVLTWIAYLLQRFNRPRSRRERQGRLRLLDRQLYQGRWDLSLRIFSWCIHRPNCSSFQSVRVLPLFLFSLF